MFFTLMVLFYSSCKNDKSCIRLDESDYEVNVKSEKEFKEGNTELALKITNEIIQSNPSNFIAFSNRAAFYFEKIKKKDFINDRDKALIYADLEKSIEICPYFLKGYRNTVIVAYELSDYKKVISYGDMFNEKFKPRSHLLALQADALWEIGEFAEGLKYSQKATSINPIDSFSYVVRGKCYSALGRYDNAIDDFNTVLRKDSTNSLAYFERGYCYKQKGEIEKTKKDYKKAIKINPDRIEVYLSLAVIEIDQNNIVEACKLYLKVKRLHEERKYTMKNQRLKKGIDEDIKKYCF
ncbi:MAG: tetratricopeptide (TPR) repeat protein [Urechidicola sp.]|jgi:tetratricopeptide (TPR) repeat protein